MTPRAKRPYASRFAIRFAIILALAMLPAGFFGFIQTKALEKEVQSRSEVALMGATLQAAAGETSLIGRVRGMVGSLAAAVPYVLDSPKACNDLMLQVAAVEPSAALVAFIPVSGVMTCSSAGRTHDFSDSPLFRQVLDAQAPDFVVNPEGPISGTSVLGISHPVYDIAGSYVGYAVMSLPHQSLKELRFGSLIESKDLDAPVVFWTFDRKGTLLTSNIELTAAATQVPSGRPMADFVDATGGIFRDTSVSGRQMTYAVVPIVAGELYLMSSFLPEEPMFTRSWGLSVYMPTLLMWLVGLAVSGFAAEFLVTRHVRTLNRSIVSFARGDRRLQAIDLKNAPSELDELATAYLAMTESITRSEAELEDSLHQKEVLLREVHHRVKNNLQLISSIMNIQIRSARSGEAKELLKNLQERIMSLATVHRGLYQTSGLADVRARELIPDIVRQIMSMSSGPEKPFETQNDIDDLRLVPDQAVPLSLMLAEALTNAIKHSGATRANPGKVVVRLKRSGGSDAVLEVINSSRDDPTKEASTAAETGIGSQLITAFVQQLGGRQESGSADGDYFLRVIFAVSPLSLAENRQSADPSGQSGWNETKD
ncbi:sensor histidine kinase [Tabrizicola piscis]|uniref:histidine kinase n=1 Tax=Tabrizicola piscis TaxID=2494374 RepID=A0A3S8U4S3_9RHOB|nr:histidine kinase dimerization/phosphoacceptor domain -containing protein [Tabrizicola piscis]AZL58539.1 sensor histidine kinase [Tabrizicola piscis]